MKNISHKFRTVIDHKFRIVVACNAPPLHTLIFSPPTHSHLLPPDTMDIIEIIEIFDDEGELENIWGDLDDYQIISGTEIQLNEFEFTRVVRQIVGKEPRGSKKAKKTKKMTKKEKKRRDKFIQNKGSRIYNKGRGSISATGQRIGL